MTRAILSHSQGVCPCVYDCPEEDTRVYAVLDMGSGGDLGTAFMRRFAQSCGVKGTSRAPWSTPCLCPHCSSGAWLVGSRVPAPDA